MTKARGFPLAFLIKDDKMMEYEFQIKRLNADFYTDFPQSSYPEILRKTKRGYNCIVCELFYDFFVCIPFRSNINHNNGYRFQTSVRSRTHKSGMDYSKMLFLQDAHYFEPGDATIDNDEYKELSVNIDKVLSGAVNYINGYINHKNGKKTLNKAEYNRKYLYSTLPYFDDVLLSNGN